MKLLLLTMLLFWGSVKVLKSQDQCSCKVNLDTLIQYVEENYVGFPEKASNKKEYLVLKENLIQKSGNKKFDFACYELLQNYISFFADPHLTIGIWPQTPDEIQQVKSIYSKFVRLPINENKSTIFAKEHLNDIEGIWQATNGQLYLIQKDSINNKYLAVVLSGDNLFWYPGQIKMIIEKIGSNYKSDIFRMDHIKVTTELILNGNTITALGLGSFYRVTNEKHNIEEQPIVSYFKMDGNAAVLKIRSAELKYKAAIDSIVTKNIGEIRTLERLYIDLRNNPGGQIMTLDTLNSIINQKNYYQEGFVLRSSNANIEQYKKLDNNEYYSDEYKSIFKSIVKKMENNKGNIFTLNPPDSVIVTPTYPQPKKVIILINKGTRSAAELFTKVAKLSSNNVIIAGTNSGGALDYTEIAQLTLPCKMLSLRYAMGTSDGEKIDNIGIYPVIKLENNNNDDWVNILEKKLSHE